MFATLPNAAMYSPSNAEEFEYAFNRALYTENGLVAVRYPRDNADKSGLICDADYKLYKKTNNEKLIITYGRIFKNVSGTNADILKLVKILPVSQKIVDICLGYRKVFLVEETYGGVANIFAEMLYKSGFMGQFHHRSITRTDLFGTLSEEFADCGLDEESLNES
jgi:1-deoxy-D-xylulose-5-phosphate synthase